MSNDSQKIQDVMYSIHNLWGAPIYVVVIVILLYNNLGWATFVGLAAMLILTFITGAPAAGGSLGRWWSCLMPLLSLGAGLVAGCWWGVEVVVALLLPAAAAAALLHCCIAALLHCCIFDRTAS